MKSKKNRFELTLRGAREPFYVWRRFSTFLTPRLVGGHKSGRPTLERSAAAAFHSLFTIGTNTIASNDYSPFFSRRYSVE